MSLAGYIAIALFIEFNVVLLLAYRTYRSYKRKYQPDINKVEAWIEALPKPPKK